MKQYLDLVNEVLKRGTRKENRTGVDTISAFNINYSIDLNEGFPLLTTKEISWKNIVIENLWFLSGDLHIGLLKKHGCKFWDHWADDEGYVPSAYGNFWRKFPIHGSDEYNDQVKYVLNTLKTNPNSRRMVISAWAPGNAQKSGLPPCHLLFIFNVQYDKDGEPRLCVHLTQRSCDVALGVPYNIAGYSFLLHLFAHLSNMKVGTFGHTLVDAHIYTKKADGSMDEYDHIPGLIEQTKRKIKSLPELVINPDIKSLEDVMDLLDKDTETIMSKFELKNYNPEPFIRFKVAV
ncbi:MAG: thymidylate synthase [Candidatus Thermoplasmatota archaeon]|nr:thymidylate synthase [Candidatus Thermoplasmatota archaeon]MEC7416242.1 thymidylate synthase [Candidatus Thermoplasmatota archaeon]MEC7493862.1 thymidylate synthase [Candidatus Thermoplasmatota archaeon]MEC7976815.1 thymidylate synthase [Candidatus Thermoplasmatota archaeon]MEC8073220.1 thymidylate synthase [Candidatus Thermoplasmatota archaeon]